ncbi:hypothetical protein [Amycolatopsis dendrobii]|uniref:Uncharacterized protein n=1 Tax=Amycolatopsis dendrobii TaxID=2760662 RepID=A0A7W3VVM0_9PSEU|nr:hypothetical protein [Amycolatopsis dendrobii]MBB1153452.1 hypothetical protein [Amycolatopsis dendrobii]
MAYHLEIGGSDQRAWLYVTEDCTADGALVVLLKPGVVLDSAKAEVLNEMFGPSGLFEPGKTLDAADLETVTNSWPATGTG